MVQNSWQQSGKLNKNEKYYFKYIFHRLYQVRLIILSIGYFISN